jgi:hypothetical protein
VKVVFIAAMQSEWEEGTLPDWLQDLPATEDSFDQWWTIERFIGFEARFEDEVDRVLAQGGRGKLMSSGSKLLQSHVEWRERQVKK